MVWMAIAVDDPTAPLAGYREPRQAVERSQVQDPVTGLPRWRYRFTGAPTLQRHATVPNRVWRVLTSRQEGAKWVVETAFAVHAQPLSLDASTLGDPLLDDLLDTLDDARALGWVHGDLGVHRLWWHGRQLRIEGYGVPWRPGASHDGAERTRGAAGDPGDREAADHPGAGDASNPARTPTVVGTTAAAAHRLARVVAVAYHHRASSRFHQRPHRGGASAPERPTTGKLGGAAQPRGLALPPWYGHREHPGASASRPPRNLDCASPIRGQLLGRPRIRSTL